MKVVEIGWCLAVLVGVSAAALGAGCGNNNIIVGTGGQTSSGMITTTASGPPTCDPLSYDIPCGACAKSACCSGYQECAADSNCVCWAGCLNTEGASSQECTNQCGAPGAVIQSFGKCVTTSCEPKCGWAMSTSASASVSSSASASSSSGGTTACIKNGNDGPCNVCAKMKCCSEVTDCVGDNNCACWIECIKNNPSNTGACTTACGNADSKTTALGSCTSKECKCP